MAFIIAILICFALYYGFEGLTSLINVDFSIESLGMKAHFDSTTRGIIDTRDIVYFLSIAAFFLAATVFKLRKES